MKKISKLLMLSGVVIPTIGVVSTIASCGSKPTPTPTPDPTDYTGDATGNNWTGHTKDSGTITTELIDGNMTITECSNDYEATDLILPKYIEYDGTKLPLIIIGHSAFQHSTLAGSITIPDSVTTINSMAFRLSLNLKTINFGKNLQEIGSDAFVQCSGITGDLIIPDSVTTLGAGAFSHCSGLDGTLTIGKSVQTIGNSAFFRCGFTGELEIPYGVKEIGMWAFEACAFEGHLSIPDSVTSIGDGAFFKCVNFTKVTIGSGITSIKYATFYSCSSLKGNLTIPDNVKSIGEAAFAMVPKLEQLTIGSGVETIGKNAFVLCGRLNYIVAHFAKAPTIVAEVVFGVAATGHIQNTDPSGAEQPYTSLDLLNFFKTKGIPDTGWEIK